MAHKRMFSLSVVDTDAFLEMPPTAQNLYFHLGMRADDDGFVGNPKKIYKMLGSGDDDLRILIGKRFVLMFESGVIVIKHWLTNNYIRQNRYNETTYIEEKSSLSLKPNRIYTEYNEKYGIIEHGSEMAGQNPANGRPRRGEERREKNIIAAALVNENLEKIEKIKKTIKEKMKTF